MRALFFIAVVTLISPAQAAEPPAGRYFQFGVRDFIPPDKQKPEPLVSLQIDLGSQDVCEKRLSAIRASPEAGDSFAPSSAWCSSVSASEQLKYHGVFRNRVNGKTFDFEAAFLDWCQIAVEMMTGGQAPNNKIEVVTQCAAR